MDKQEVLDQLNALTVDGDFTNEDQQYLINWLMTNGATEGSPRDMMQIRRGNISDLPNLVQGELAYTFDTEELFVGGLNGNISLAPKTWLHNETINFIGDSITAEGSGKITYVERIKQLLKCKTNNYGVGGMSFVGDHGFWTVVPSLDVNAKVNVVMGGINDYLLGVPIGSIIDVDSATTFYTAIEKFAKAIVNRTPNAITIMVTPLKAEISASGANYSQEEIVKAIYYIANKYNFIVLDLYSNAPNLNPNISSLRNRWQPDGIHPNQLYVDNFLSKIIAENLVSLQAGGNSLLVKKDFCRLVQLNADTVITNQTKNLTLFGDASTTNNNMFTENGINIVKSGLYQINVHSTISAPLTTGNIVAGVALNNSPFLMGVYDFNNLNSEHKMINLSYIMPLVVGDVLTIRVSNNTDKNVDFTTNTLSALEI